MKKIHVNVLMEVNVSDEEYEELRRLAKDPDSRGKGIYNNVFAPKWVENRAKETGNIINGNAIILSSSWTDKDDHRYH